MNAKAETTAGKQRGRPFPKGISGNLTGRPQGARHAALVALDAIGSAAATAILERVILDAKAGDMRAAEIVLGRIWPARKGRAITLPLPDVRTAADVTEAMAAVIRAMAVGDLSPEEAVAVSAVIEGQRRAIANLDGNGGDAEGGPTVRIEGGLPRDAI